ncbi:hypothetical protein FS749_011477, partial [Ceratobasidium sp. UAMH 11750]
MLGDLEGLQPLYYGNIKGLPVFSAQDSNKLRMLAEELHDMLKDSTEALELTLLERSNIVNHELSASDMVLEADDIKWDEIQPVLDEWS